MIQDAELLSMYVEERSEDAFSELVQRYLPLVHSAALRQTNGNTDLAKDIAQTVFVDLARKASRLLPRSSLAGWLYASTRLASLKALRGIERQRVRERIAFDMQTQEANATASPTTDLTRLLDDAMCALDSEQREALLLRFFQGKDLKEVGAALSISEDAARMRINRSLSKLHSILAGRGVCLSCEALAATLTTEAVTAVPAGLASHISCTVMSSVASAAGTQMSLLQLVTTSKIHAGIAAVLIGTGVAAPFLVHHAAQGRLSEAQRQLTALSSELSTAVAEREHLQTQIEEFRASDGKGVKGVELGELLRLRGEVTLLRRQIREASGVTFVPPTLLQSAAPAAEASTHSPIDGTNVVIQFVGPRLVGEDVVRTNISRSGDGVSGQEAIDQDVRNIYATGYFNDVKVVEKTNRAGNSLVYLVKCRPHLALISFVGNTVFTEQELRKQISSQPGTPLNERLLLTDSQAIERSYQESGHQRATVKTLQAVDEPAGSAAVVFEITENL